jgi:PIN domain nuclease of toxin-antitoxin system
LRLLLDTSVVVRILQGLESSMIALAEIARAETVHVSAVSIWEIAIKTSIGKLKVDVDALLAQLPRDGFEELPVTWRHGRAVRNLPLHHSDPFDRLLVAQAIDESMRLLTHDAGLMRYSDLVTVA